MRVKKGKILVAQKKPGLTVKDITELQPLAEVYELNQFRKYIIVVKKSSIIGLDPTRTRQTAEHIARVLIGANIKCHMIVGIEDDVKFLEIS